MADYYKGDEIKFAIELTAPGFSMDDDDFTIEVASPSNSVKGYKNPPQDAGTDVMIFKESDSSSSEETTDESGGTWYAIVNTSKLAVGALRVIATALIPDAHADDGIRTSIAVQKLATLKNP